MIKLSFLNKRKVLKMELYKILAEAPVRGNQVKELYIFAEDKEELQKKLSSAFKKTLKYSEKLDGHVNIVSEKSWNLGRYDYRG